MPHLGIEGCEFSYLGLSLLSLSLSLSLSLYKFNEKTYYSVVGVYHILHACMYFSMNHIHV